jgi:hypothetical protein
MELFTTDGMKSMTLSFFLSFFFKKTYFAVPCKQLFEVNFFISWVMDVAFITLMSAHNCQRMYTTTTTKPFSPKQVGVA